MNSVTENPGPADGAIATSVEIEKAIISLKNIRAVRCVLFLAHYCAF